MCYLVCPLLLEWGIAHSVSHTLSRPAWDKGTVLFQDHSRLQLSWGDKMFLRLSDLYWWNQKINAGNPSFSFIKLYYLFLLSMKS